MAGEAQSAGPRGSKRGREDGEIPESVEHPFVAECREQLLGCRDVLLYDLTEVNATLVALEPLFGSSFCLKSPNRRYYGAFRGRTRPLGRDSATFAPNCARGRAPWADASRAGRPQMDPPRQEVD